MRPVGEGESFVRLYAPFDEKCELLFFCCDGVRPATASVLGCVECRAGCHFFGGSRHGPESFDWGGLFD